MPLDSAARQYAKTLYVDELERLSNEHSKLTAELVTSRSPRKRSRRFAAAGSRTLSRNARRPVG